MGIPAALLETASTASTITTLMRNITALSIQRENALKEHNRRLDLLPKDMLHPILDLVYQDITASPCSCFRCLNQASQAAARIVSFAHRIIDTSTLRSTCLAFHTWALYRITHPHGYERLEIDFSDFASLCVRMSCSGECVLGRLIADFSLLSPSSLVLYLGNPGDVSNIRLVSKMLQMEPPNSVERTLVGGLSFWKSDTSSRTSKSAVSKLAAKTSHQPVYESYNDGEGTPLYNAKALTKIENYWIRERKEELEIIVDLYNTIAEGLTSSSYTQIPLAILKAKNPYALTSFGVFMRNCKQVVLREFRGLDQGHTAEYMHELYNIAEVEGLPHHRKLLLQPIITNMMWSLNKRLWPTERETWCHNLDKLETLPANRGAGGQNIHLSLKSQHEKVYGHRVWRLLDDSVLLTASVCFFTNVSSLTLSGGMADNVTLFGLLTALSANPDNLQSLTYLPEIPETKMTTSKHSCPLFGQFKSLVDVHLGCSFCPEALKGTRSVSTSIERKKRWLIKWPTAMPCLFWREQIEREKQMMTTKNPCTTLAIFLEGCRSAMYAVDGHYSKIIGACGKYDDSLWHLELNVRIDRFYTILEGLRGKLAFEIIFIPLSHPPQASVGVKGSATKVLMVEDDILGQWRSGKGWPAQPPQGVPMLGHNLHGLSWDSGH